MKPFALSLPHKKTLLSLLLDLGALAFIYLVPTLSHWANLPLYLMEPMRLMLVLALAHTHRINAYLLALTLPLFSFLVSGHPVPIKMGLIAFELTLNVFLFFLLQKRFRYVFPAILLSILFSKAAYYIAKYLLIQYSILDMEVFSSPVWSQVLVIGGCSMYVWGVRRKVR